MRHNARKSRHLTKNVTKHVYCVVIHITDIQQPGVSINHLVAISKPRKKLLLSGLFYKKLGSDKLGLVTTPKGHKYTHFYL